MPTFHAGPDALEQGEAPRVPPRGFRAWLLQGMNPRAELRARDVTHPWWQVMCLTGVDYFSSLGYQPAIAAVAAGLLSPLATVVLILVTLLGALPVYRRVARESFRGAGSIEILERLLPWWTGKVVVLVLLGFAITDFVITITLSTSDAAAHVVGNPLMPAWLQSQQLLIALVLVLLLGIVFLKGFTEAITIAVVLVAAFMSLNAVVLAVALGRVVAAPHVVTDWWAALTQQHGDPILAIGVAILVFPRLALGLSGFETGVAVIPQITGKPGDTPANPRGRIRGAQRLLTTAALIMSVFLLLSSLATTLLIPLKDFAPGGAANGRALSYLAHHDLGPAFGTVYDISTIAILWFAGASAMAGLIDLVPRYLPKYGMSPQWARAPRPLVLVFTALAIVIVIIFQASVDGQGGAYGTGVLAVITSAAVAVMVSAIRQRQRWRSLGFGITTLVFLYTTVVNIVERPDGIRIASLFILGLLVVSVVSRVLRSYGLRATSVSLDDSAQQIVQTAAQAGALRFVARNPTTRPPDAPSPEGILLEVLPADPSDFEEPLVVKGEVVTGDATGSPALRVTGTSVPTTLASVLLAVRDLTGVVPEILITRAEGNAVSNTLRFLVTGSGETASITREVLRRAEKDAARRPVVRSERVRRARPPAETATGAAGSGAQPDGRVGGEEATGDGTRRTGE